jgi:hypothetical protein
MSDTGGDDDDDDNDDDSNEIENPATTGSKSVVDALGELLKKIVDNGGDSLRVNASDEHLPWNELPDNFLKLINDSKVQKSLLDHFIKTEDTTTESGPHTVPTPANSTEEHHEQSGAGVEQKNFLVDENISKSTVNAKRTTGLRGRFSTPPPATASPSQNRRPGGRFMPTSRSKKPPTSVEAEAFGQFIKGGSRQDSDGYGGFGGSQDADTIDVMKWQKGRGGLPPRRRLAETTLRPSPRRRIATSSPKATGVPSIAGVTNPNTGSTTLQCIVDIILENFKPSCCQYRTRIIS